jgi:hypothetical protein
MKIIRTLNGGLICLSPKLLDLLGVDTIRSNPLSETASQIPSVEEAVDQDVCDGLDSDVAAPPHLLLFHAQGETITADVKALWKAFIEGREGAVTWITVAEPCAVVTITPTWPVGRGGRYAPGGVFESDIGPASDFESAPDEMSYGDTADLQDKLTNMERDYL